MSRTLIGRPVWEVILEREGSTTRSTACLCTLDEFLDGHRCRCVEHRICGECEEDWIGDTEDE